MIALLGFTTTLVTITLSLVPASDEPHPFIAVAKIVGLTFVLLAGGGAIFHTGRKRRQKLT
jgi:hypothetical protein